MDVGRQVVDYVFERMQIDGPWAVREPSRFTWWGGALAQRVWAMPPRERDGVLVTQVHIETDLLRNIASMPDAFERLAALNLFSTLSAYIADVDAGAIRLHASVSATEDNLPLARLLALHATALQVADAHAEADALAELFEAEPDGSAHPEAGARTEEDDMLGVADIYASRGEGGSPFGTDELAALVHVEPRPWTSASNEAHSLRAELPFDGGEPARLHLDAAFRHTSLGSGLRLTLTQPLAATSARIQALNAAECDAPDAHQLGGWCASEQDRVMFASFIPAAAYVPNLARALVYHAATRNGWAHEVLHTH
jgi:hypothetical protein